MGVQNDLVADRGDLAERLGGHREPVADAAALNNDMVTAANRDTAGEQGDHAGAPAGPFATARASGARLRSQIATASASAA
jgi:hypothetical protein